VELRLQDKGAVGNALQNNRPVVESGRREQKHTLLADESLSPAFRGFIEIWARKLQSVEQHADRPRPLSIGTLEEFNAPSLQDLF
jgi:hypothetical protein